jgi:hypothetical protein
MIKTLILIAVGIVCTIIIVSDNRRQHRKTRRIVKREVLKVRDMYVEIYDVLKDVLKTYHIQNTIEEANKTLEYINNEIKSEQDEFDINSNRCTYIGNAKDLNKSRE